MNGGLGEGEAIQDLILMVVRWIGRVRFCFKNWPSQFSPAPHYTATAQPAAGLGQARVSSTANRDNKSQGKYIFFRNLISNFNG